MAFATEVHGDSVNYMAILEHTPTARRLSITAVPYKESGSMTEAQKDALFQAFLDKVAQITDVTVISATKRGEFSANITVT